MPDLETVTLLQLEVLKLEIRAGFAAGVTDHPAIGKFKIPFVFLETNIEAVAEELKRIDAANREGGSRN